MLLLFDTLQFLFMIVILSPAFFVSMFPISSIGSLLQCLRPHVVLPSAGLHHPVCPPSCVSTSPSASLRTAAVTGCTSMGTANARRAGVGLAVTTWCANCPPAVPTVSVHRVSDDW